MDQATVVNISQNTLLVLFKLSMPILLVALTIGVLISLFQALTQIQEASLSFVPKLIAIFITLLLMLPYMGSVMYLFTEELMSIIVQLE